MVGSSLRVWKGYPSDSANGFSVLHGPYGSRGRGIAFPSRVHFSSRAYPVYTAGRLLALRYRPARSFQMRARSPHVPVGDRARATVVFLPLTLRGCLAAMGAQVQPSARSGPRYAYVYPRGGVYRVYTSRCR